MARSGTKKRSRSPSLQQIQRQLQELTEKLEQRLHPGFGTACWWEHHAGRFEGDPMFAEIVRLGRAQRERERRAASKRASA